MYVQILDLAAANGGAGATVLKGVAGYRFSQNTVSEGFADVEQRALLVIVIVDTEERVASLLPRIEELIRPEGGLITVQNLEKYILLPARKDGKGRRAD